MNTRTLTLTTIALVAFAAFMSANADTTPEPDPILENKCVAVPPGMSEATKKCYEDECTKFLSAIENCQAMENPDHREVCIAFQRAWYSNQLGLCLTAQLETETSDDLVIWLNSQGYWTVAWPGEEYESIAPRFDFNI